MNTLLTNMNLVAARAEYLGHSVVSVIDNVILCKRGDGTYTTWRAAIYIDTERDGKVFAEFISGCYDMTLPVAQENLIERAGYGTIKADNEKAKQELYFELNKERLAADYEVMLTLNNVEYYVPNDESEYIIAVVKSNNFQGVAVETNFYELDDFTDHNGAATEYAYAITQGRLTCQY